MNAEFGAPGQNLQPTQVTCCVTFCSGVANECVHSSSRFSATIKSGVAKHNGSPESDDLWSLSNRGNRSVYALLCTTALDLHQHTSDLGMMQQHRIRAVSNAHDRLHRRKHLVIIQSAYTQQQDKS